jgi:ribosomal protein S18 acetylase RimI-like enzyme
MTDNVRPAPLQTMTLDVLLAADLSENHRRREEACSAEADRLLQTGEELTIEIRASEFEASVYISDVEVGRVEWSPGHLYIERIEVHPGLRRRGIATALWQAVHGAGIKITHADQRTVDGAAWAVAVSGQSAGHFEPCDDWYDALWCR